MAIGSILTKGVRRTGENKKPQSEFPSSKTSSSFRKISNQGDSDSEATSFSSSVRGSTSTSSATSSMDRYSNSSGMEGGNHQRKAPDKLNSKKPTAFRQSRRRAQSQLMSLPDDGPATTHHPVQPSDASPDVQKPVHKFTRSGSLRSLRILRKKNMSSSESNKSSTVKDLPSKKATFSSILKDSKFPKQVKPQVGVKESEQVLSAAKLCPYEHCSLHGNHHHHEPPLQRFSHLKRRPSKDQKSINPQTRVADKRPVKKTEVKVTKNVSNQRGKKKNVDFSIEFYAKTRPDPSFDEPNCGRDDLQLAEIMFGVNGNDQNEVLNLQMDDQDRSVVNNDNQVSMWRLIHRHMVSGLIEQRLQEEKQSCFDDDDAVNQGKEIQKTLAIKMVREAIEKILLPEEDGSEKNQGDDQNEPNQAANDPFGTKKDKPNGWNYVKKVVLMRRFITELENAKRKLDPDKRGQVPLAPKLEPEPKPEAGIVCLRSGTISENKNSNEWMLDYALQQVVAELAPTQKRKVALLVKSFEMITPKVDKEEMI
ncbi:hypothetical protein L1987_59918 [Smallanthus sonchifolius]|uniref:Uncharacterized protein n=1 Tax=Smallanthus sonchifolius TaxID=185202 RepID=A0ACB9D6J9_9ASTR|nr:hypothetical protein L1987_59918 [Smallanthus sonchifolius]